MAKVIKNNLGNFLVICLIFLMMTVWIFSGKPQIWKKPAFPPEIQKVWAAVAFQAASGIATSTGAYVTVTLPVHAANDIFLLQVAL